jgi:hypothetical protein
MLESYTEGLLARAQWPGWRTTLCRLSESIYFTLRISCHSPRPVGVCAIWALGARDDVASTVVKRSSHTCSLVQINSSLLTANEKGSYCNLTFTIADRFNINFLHKHDEVMRVADMKCCSQRQKFGATDVEERSHID